MSWWESAIAAAWAVSILIFCAGFVNDGLREVRRRALESRQVEKQDRAAN